MLSPLRRTLPPGRGPLGAAAAVLTALAVAGCGGSSPSASATSSTAKSPTTSASASASPTTAKSDVKGRMYDAGTITSSKQIAGLTVLVLDRWTVKGMSDATLASKGAPISPHSDVRYTDQNHSKTYLVPVTPCAPIVVNTCVKAKGQKPGMTSTPETLKQFLASPHRSTTIVLLTYDSSGRLTRLDTDPQC